MRPPTPAVEPTEHDNRPSGRRAEAAEVAILDAATALLLEVGYERMSIDAVAERAHAGKATIYRHFSDKASLVLAAVIRCGDAGDCEPADTGSLRSDLLVMARDVATAMAGFDGALFAGLLNATRTNADLAALFRERFAQRPAVALGTIARRAVARGELRDASRAAVLAEVATAVVLHRLLVVAEPPDENFLTHLVDSIAIPVLAWTGPLGESARLPRS